MILLSLLRTSKSNNDNNLSNHNYNIQKKNNRIIISSYQKNKKN